MEDISVQEVSYGFYMHRLTHDRCFARKLAAPVVVEGPRGFRIRYEPGDYCYWFTSGWQDEGIHQFAPQFEKDYVLVRENVMTREEPT